MMEQAKGTVVLQISDGQPLHANKYHTLLHTEQSLSSFWSTRTSVLDPDTSYYFLDE